MTPERWQQIEQLYHAALTRAPVERAAFLALVCAADESLRHEVEVLLAANAEASGFLTLPALQCEAQQMAAETPPGLAIGQQLGHYKILAPIGAGGMGEVYLARDARLERQVAIKVLPAQFTRDAERLQRFLREAQAASALNHPNIITIHEIGQAAGALQFIVTEFIDGETLRQRLGGEKLPPAQALDLAVQMAGALKAAHACGIVHRDIKPENVMVRPDGLVKVLDFGLAKLTERRPTPPTDLVDTQALTAILARTEPGTVMGTPAYMSPEQARGLTVDARTDIFSLGIMLYEMLAGRRPFTGATISDVLVALLDREPPPLTELAPDVSAPLAASIARALVKDCAGRYQTMAEFLLELEHHKLRLGFEAELARSGSSDPTPKRPPKRPATNPAARRARKTIDALAVLPLVNASADPETEYLSDGLTESLINNLSRLPRLRVMARATVFRYKGRGELDPRTVGSELDVRAVLTGRVLHRGDQLIIKVELVSTDDGAQLWGEQYQRPFSDIFTLEDEMAREISANLRLRLSGAQKNRLAKPPSTNVAAYQLYLQGRHHLNKWTAEGFQKALEYLQQAVALDPHFALAYAGLSDVLSDLCTRGHVAAHEYFPKAKAAALRALALDDKLAEAHCTLAKALHYYDWDWPAAEREYKLALKLNPNRSIILIQYSMFLVCQERFVEALRMANRAQELDPLSAYVGLVRGWLLWLSQQDELCIQQGQKLVELEPSFYGGHWLIAVTYFQQGRYAEALPCYQQANSLGNTPQLKVGLARASAALGQPEQARQVIAELQHLSHVPSYYLGEIYAELNDLEQAFAWLERAYEERDSHLVIFKLDRCFDKLRGDPRYASLLRRIGLPA